MNLDNDDHLKVLQLTDTHLTASKDGHLLGMQTSHSLDCVLDLVTLRHTDIDLVLITGDLSQDGTAASYELLGQHLQRLDAPSCWLPGNHDDAANMDSVDAPGREKARVVKGKHWQIVLLNSQVPGKVYGELAADQLQLLEQSLQQSPQLHTLITFHHHPKPMGSRWIDNIGIRNCDELLAIVERYDNAKCLLWGHVHQSSDEVINGVRYLSSPSTCVQFEPNSEDFSVDRKGPGYRWLVLNPDGSIDTEVQRVENVEFEVDYSVKGY